MFSCSSELGAERQVRRSDLTNPSSQSKPLEMRGVTIRPKRDAFRGRFVWHPALNRAGCYSRPSLHCPIWPCLLLAFPPRVAMLIKRGALTHVLSRARTCPHRNAFSTPPSTGRASAPSCDSKIVRFEIDGNRRNANSYVQSSLLPPVPVLRLFFIVISEHLKL